MRRFYLQRTEDVSGPSGEGRVADGVQFDDGVCVLRWGAGVAGFATTVVHDDGIESIEGIHGHDGRTTVRWLDA